MDVKIIFSVCATVIAVISYVPYISDIRAKRTKPHGFSWVIWAILGYIAGIAQLKSGAGVGSTVALVTGTLSAWIAYISLKGNTIRITIGDWVSLVAALAAIPIWIVTKQPLLSVIIVSFIDIVGFWPTIRKSYYAPKSETFSTQVLSAIKHCLTVAALQKYSFTTVLYPGSLAITTWFFVGLLIVRKRQFARKP